MENELLRVIEEARMFGKVLGALNATFVALIPKKNDQKSFEDFSTIPMCNSMYKIITKSLANRLKGVFSKFISKE